jgi:hypothetical protein
MKTMIFSLLLTLFALQLYSLPVTPCNKAIKANKEKKMLKPRITPPDSEKSDMMLNLPVPRCGGFMKRSSYQ